MYMHVYICKALRVNPRLGALYQVFVIIIIIIIIIILLHICILLHIFILLHICRLRESTPKEKTGVESRRRSYCKLSIFLATSAAELVPNVLGFLFFGAYQQLRDGDPDAWATQVFHIICPGLHPGEDTLASTQLGKQQLPVISLIAELA